MRTAERRAASILALLCAGMLPAVAKGQPGESNPHAEAVARFQEGTVLVTQRDCAGAVLKFRESLALEPGVGARLDLADCEERLGTVDAAWKDFRLAERFASSRGDSRAAMAHARAAALESKLQVVRMERIEGLDLRVDGQAVEPELLADGSVALAPGPHSLVASAPGRDTVTLTVSGRAGETVTLTVPPHATAPAPLPQPARTVPGPSRGATQRALGLGALGLGVAGVAVGSVAGIFTFVKHHDATSACGGSYPHCDLSTQSTVTSANSAAQTDGTISTVSFVIGALGLAGGAAQLLTAPSDRATQSAWLLSPAIGAGGGGATLRGRW